MQWRSKLDSKAHFEIEHKVMRGEARSFEDIRLIWLQNDEKKWLPVVETRLDLTT